MNTTDFPSLTQLLGCYFHQDFVEEFATPEDAVDAFLGDASAELIGSACDELDRALLLTQQGAEDPQKLLQELGCYYDPSADGLTINGWLEQVLEKLKSKRSAASIS